MRTMNRLDQPFRGATLQEQFNHMFGNGLRHNGEESNLTPWAPAVGRPARRQSPGPRHPRREQHPHHSRRTQVRQQGARRQLSAHRARLWLLQPQLLAGQLRQIGVDPSRLPQWRADAKPAQARGSQAEADQGQRQWRNIAREASCTASTTAKVSSSRPRRPLKEPGRTRSKKGLATSPAPFLGQSDVLQRRVHLAMGQFDVGDRSKSKPARLKGKL